MATIVIGGGVVGLSIAYGLLKAGKKVIVLDGADNDFRASRGNFGLIWIQGKGANEPNYATWSRRSAALWKDFAEELLMETGIDVAYQNGGGIDYFTDEDKLEKRMTTLTSLRDDLGGDYPFEFLEHKELKEQVPEIGSKVHGGIYSPMDAHINPLFLLRALSTAVLRLNGQIITGTKVVDIKARDNDFVAVCQDSKEIEGDRVVLSAGLGAKNLGGKLGFKVPIRPQQGQILITEKLPFFLRYPSNTIRQVNEGGIQIGASKAEVGLDDKEDIATIAALADHAVSVFPHLENVKLVRTWAALRIMSPDGLPIYQRSPTVSGASFVTCHSGITLSAIHARRLPDWILEKSNAADLSCFSEERFNV